MNDETLKDHLDNDKEYTLEEVRAFLCGEASLDGLKFGEIVKGRPAFWWRKHLRKAIEAHTQSKLKAFAGEVEEAIGEDLPPCWAHDSRDDGEDYQGVDSVEIAGHKHYPCSTNEEAEQFNLRLTEQRQALKAIKEKYQL